MLEESAEGDTPKLAVKDDGLLGVAQSANSDFPYAGVAERPGRANDRGEEKRRTR